MFLRPFTIFLAAFIVVTVATTAKQGRYIDNTVNYDNDDDYQNNQELLNLVKKSLGSTVNMLDFALDNYAY